MDKAIRHHTKQIVDTFQSTGCETSWFPDSGGMLASSVQKLKTIKPGSGFDRFQ